MSFTNVVITGTGSYIPKNIVTNADFAKHKFYAITSVIEGICNVVLSIILLKKYGIVGVALGTAIPMLEHRVIA